MTGAGLPDTPAGAAAGWVMEVLAAHEDELSDAELEERFHRRLLHAVPAPALRRFLVNVRDTGVGGEIVAAETRSPSEVDWLVPTVGGEPPVHLHLAVDFREPHRITALRATPFEEADTLAIPVAETRRDVDTLPGSSAEAVDRFTAEAVDRLGLVGLEVTVVHPDGVHHAHRGWIDVEVRAEWSPTIVHRIASVAKTMTAAAVVRLAVAGLVDLDDEVGGLLKEIDVPGGVTIRHLLTHTGAIEADAAGGFESDVNPLTLPELLADGVRHVGSPGVERAYSNVGFALLGQLVEDVTGAPFSEHVEADVFLPLGMTSTAFGERDEARGTLATGYSVHFGRAAPEPWVADTLPAAGAALSTPADMARWMAALAGDLGHWLLEPQTELVADGSQGLGLRLFERDGHRLAWHNGGWPGWSASMWVAPDDGWGVYLCTNTGDRTGGGDDLDEAGGRLILELLGGDG